MMRASDAAGGGRRFFSPNLKLLNIQRDLGFVGFDVVIRAFTP